jgi:hypothetical protein
MECTYNTTNFLGFIRNTPVGTSTKPMINIAAAARFNPPNRSKRSQRETLDEFKQRSVNVFHRAGVMSVRKAARCKSPVRTRDAGTVLCHSHRSICLCSQVCNLTHLPSQHHRCSRERTYAQRTPLPLPSELELVMVLPELLSGVVFRHR